MSKTFPLFFSPILLNGNISGCSLNSSGDAVIVTSIVFDIATLLSATAQPAAPAQHYAMQMLMELGAQAF
jgi:hypothetical protein